MRLFLLFFLILRSMTYCFSAEPFEETSHLPLSFQGRFRSLESAARLWLHDRYHLQKLKSEHLASFDVESNSPVELLWKVHVLGHSFMDKAPLFWIHYAEVKTLLGLPPQQSHFSYHQLAQALFEDKKTNLQFMRILLPYEFAKTRRLSNQHSQNSKQELRHLAPGLWMAWQGGELTLSAKPDISPWNLVDLKTPLTVKNINLEQLEKQTQHTAEALMELLRQIRSYEAFTASLSNKTFDASTNKQHALQQSGSTLKMLPSKLHPGEWLPLDTLNTQIFDPEKQSYTAIGNFTSFSDTDFHRLQQAYRQLQEKILARYHPKTEKNTNPEKSELQEAVHHFSTAYMSAYQSMMGQPYQEASGKQLFYPSQTQLQAETFYYRIPLIEISLLAFIAALTLFFIAYMTQFSPLNSWALVFLAIGFILQTSVLVLRCFVLQRPPVSNMFETVIYVPWIATLIGIILFALLRHRILLITAAVTSVGLLILLKLANVDSRMENVQAVLDSQYWLIVHVLMVVASYGAFIMCGILGHLYLIASLMPQKIALRQLTAQCLLQTMYIGIALLIPGTILGGVWAAESWGRFWDWDPKESWAFISACIYVLIIHAYTFKKIHEHGLAVGSIVGLMAISFTWYGVNYILGTGLHSYGFGQGGEFYYYTYLFFEILFITSISSILSLKTSQKKQHNTNKKIIIR